MEKFKFLMQAVNIGHKVETITLIAAPVAHNKQLGEMLLVFQNEETTGFIIDADFTKLVLVRIKEQSFTEPCILNLVYQGQDYQVFWNIVGNEQYRAIILGGGHISQPLVQILAMLDYEVTVVDDRLEFANAVRFPGAKSVRCASFSEVLQDINPDAETAVIIVTRGHKYDLDCLRSVINTKAGYIGMIGSRRKVRATLEVLKGEGVKSELLAKVRAPIGLDLGGQSPAEIGVSIAAEVIATFKGGSYLPLSAKGKVLDHG